MATEILDPAIGGGGGIDDTPRPVDFGDPDDPHSYQRRIESAVISADYIRRYGGIKPNIAGSLPPELARSVEERADLAPTTGEIAIMGYNFFAAESSN